jgi:hypothetical protein
MTRWNGPAVTGTENGIDFDARYTVADMPGVAFWLPGWVTEWTQEDWTLDCDSADPDHEHDDACYLYNEPEQVPNVNLVRAVMVGDDREHIVSTDDLTEIPEDGYCAGCGQIGCFADGRAA